ncbi:MAG: hypothetical protein U5K56_08745 [Halioglobus sp.]|nr:hypothetical protein [Halioglobus sp.]
MLRPWLVALSLALFTQAAGGDNTRKPQEQQVEEVVVTGEPVEEKGEPIWVDAGHAYASERTQALAEWMDDFFGDSSYDLDKAESLLRLRWTHSVEQGWDYNTKVRLKGKIQLPKISERLNLVFGGEDGDDFGFDQDTDSEPTQESDEGQAGLAYRLAENNRNRFDLTLNANSSGLRPGGRFRSRGPLGNLFSYRYTQRLEWELDEGFFTTAKTDINHLLAENRLARWTSRVIYGEESEGAEWHSGLSLNTRLSRAPGGHEQVNSVFFSVVGTTDPSYVHNYKLGVSMRRQLFRPFFHAELEPAYNFRKESPDNRRRGAWSVLLRLEILFDRDLTAARIAASDT